ncbi:MMPL family transporter [Modestobacter versicolor]|uniref:RND superfamily putative drug exporter n=1 Tax=Modestobacter versicolor TaxID=429133 RepID=A0A839XYA8_9ACTN|nr:MMPL family transporter [Modestobacter versicolor]MBB3675968.1 RND superfamily putative drug exporter [Modestobacter versicolor]
MTALPETPPRRPRDGAVVRIARWSATHRWTVVGLWLLAVVLAVVVGSATGTNTLSGAESGSGESGRADVVLDDAGFPDPPTEQVLVQTRDGSAIGPEGTSAANAVAAAVRSLDEVAEVGDPVPSLDGTALLVPVTLDVGDLTGGDAWEAGEDAVGPVLDAVAGVQADHPDLWVTESGGSSIGSVVGEQLDDDFQRAEFLSLPVTLAVLLVAFGALLAAGVPLLLGITAVGGALGLVSLVSQLRPIDESTSSVVLLIGMAVGVDYALFYVRRVREERRHGAGTGLAVELAAATSGRAVLTSGIAVAVAMSGMYLAGNAVFTSFATGTILVVAVSVIGSLTVLPATLALLGRGIERPRVPLIGRLVGRTDDSRVWGAVVRRVVARPGISLAVGAGVLLAVAVPAIGMKTAMPGIDALSRDSEVVRAYDAIAVAYPQEGTTDEVVLWRADGDELDAPAVRAAVAELTAALPDPTAAGEVEFNPAGTVARVSIAGAGEADSADAVAGLERLREDLVPGTVGDLPGVTTAVTGDTAGSLDFGSTMSDRLPVVIGFVLALTIVVLTVAFRSLAVALIAAVLTLLSVGAAYGVLVLVFQSTWAEGLLGFTSTGSIVSWLPLFLFVVLFGLSMDYHVFVVSRVREAAQAGIPMQQAITTGVTRSAGVVTSAAVVMVAVFSIFATLSMLEFKQLGVGLAVAVLIDATLVRGVLLPATMALLGERTWWLPRWLHRLPAASH